MAESVRGNGFSEKFWDNFKKSKFYEVYKKHTDELFIGVRDGYINIYYNCASIAKIRGKRGTVGKAQINEYYLKQDSKDDKYVSITEDDFVKYYEHIKARSDAKVNLEKKSQERLVLDNNNNPNSGWYCLDVEYMKSICGERKPWRFDIIAISKSKPHCVALIELKYGSGAIGGESGIQKHIKDYKTFHDEKGFVEYLKSEIVGILKKQKELRVGVPKEFDDIKKQDVLDIPKIYVITLDNNKDSTEGSTPKMKMGGYLFKDKKKWNSPKVADNVLNDKSKKYYDFESSIEKIKPTFLFSKAKLVSGRLNKPITDILAENNYEDVEKFD